MSAATPPVILSIAGYDPSSGAGVTADVKTAAAHGCFAITCITAVTVQNTLGVRRVRPLEPGIVSETLFELAADFPIAAVRVGMLGNAAVAEAVTGFLETSAPPHVVVDPIFRSSSGASLFGGETFNLKLLRLAEVLTPNASEAGFLAGLEVSNQAQAREAARKILASGARNVVVTGGHLPENTDLLVWNDATGEAHEELFAGEKINSDATHGTGCAFATSIACNLALGKPVPEAVCEAKEYVRNAIKSAYPLGGGKGPMNHLFRNKSE